MGWLRGVALLGFAAGALCVVPACRVHAQEADSALSDAEVEKLRDKAPIPPERVLAFVDFLDFRTKEIDRLSAGKRRAGREEDIHELMEQFTSIADELDDNLDEYGKGHKDVRKVLPKLLAATERWATTLKSPPEHEAYNVSRKLALEAVADIRQEATAMVEEQKAYFLAHPPPKEEGSGGRKEAPRSPGLSPRVWDRESTAPGSKLNTLCLLP